MSIHFFVLPIDVPLVYPGVVDMRTFRSAVLNIVLSFISSTFNYLSFMLGYLLNY